MSISVVVISLAVIFIHSQIKNSPKPFKLFLRLVQLNAVSFVILGNSKENTATYKTYFLCRYVSLPLCLCLPHSLSTSVSPCLSVALCVTLFLSLSVCMEMKNTINPKTIIFDTLLR